MAGVAQGAGETREARVRFAGFGYRGIDKEHVLSFRQDGNDIELYLMLSSIFFKCSFSGKSAFRVLISARARSFRLLSTRKNT